MYFSHLPNAILTFHGGPAERGWEKAPLEQDDRRHLSPEATRHSLEIGRPKECPTADCLLTVRGRHTPNQNKDHCMCYICVVFASVPKYTCIYVYIEAGALSFNEHPVDRAALK
jgi:hypothetical protein